MAVFYTYKTTMEEEKMVFLKCLYHDKRNGQAIRLRKQEDVVTQYSTFVLDDLAATGTDMANLYTSVNSFKGGKRTSANIFNYCSIFIDIDCHAMDIEGIKKAKRRTVEILEEAYASGKLAEPTLITDTGRGFGLQYVLTRSIANINQTEKQQLFFKKVRKCLFERYRDILAVDPMAAQPDASSLDDARVCRLPGTYNKSAGTYCRLIGISGIYYELSKIVQECHLWTWVNEEEYQKKKEEKEKKRKERLAAGKVIPFSEICFPFLSARVEQLMKLQDLRGKNCTDDCREQILFIAYSAYVQLDRETAVSKLKELNIRFTDPLDQTELDHIVEETDASVGFDHRGFYKLKNNYLIERLNLNEEEIKALGLDMGWQRTAARQSARQRKKEKREKVIELLKQVERLTYDEIAKMVGVSKRKVCTIAKEENLMRYHKAAGQYHEKNEDSKDKADSMSIAILKQGDMVMEGESAKIAKRSVCVPLSFSPRTLLSTPLERELGGVGGLDWYGWLLTVISKNAVARELFYLYEWSSWDSTVFFGELDTYLEQTIPGVIEHPEQLNAIRDTVARKFFDYYKKDGCAYLFGVYNVAEKLPTVWKLFAHSGKKTAEQKKRKQRQTVDVKTETLEQREKRIGRYLEKYEDERFVIIESTAEYLRRLDSNVLRMFKITCMQVQRLKRDFLYVEGKKIPILEIQSDFSALTYKDIVVLCERIAHQGRIKNVMKPFFYIIGCVSKYKHPELAEKQAERMAQLQKSVGNKFCNFNQIDIKLELLQVNKIRELIGKPLLTEKEYVELINRE